MTTIHLKTDQWTSRKGLVLWGMWDSMHYFPVTTAQFGVFASFTPVILPVAAQNSLQISNSYLMKESLLVSSHWMKWICSAVSTSPLRIPSWAYFLHRYDSGGVMKPSVSPICLIIGLPSAWEYKTSEGAYKWQCNWNQSRLRAEDAWLFIL